MSKVNQIQKAAGWATLDFANWSLRDAYQVKSPTMINFGEITNVVRKTLPGISVEQRDFNFALANWDTWLNFLGDLTAQKKIKYYSERFDCDNFARYVSSLTSLYLLLNSCGMVHCTVYNNTTGAKIAGHYANLIPASTNDVYLYDLNNNGGWTKITFGKDPVIGNWKYKNLDRVEFF